LQLRGSNRGSSYQIQRQSPLNQLTIGRSDIYFDLVCNITKMEAKNGNKQH
jgi:hypothetical protein